MRRPPLEKLSVSIFVKGQGPAMQETLALPNSLPSPASRETPPTVAFHFPSGEQGGMLLQGTFPVLTTSKDFTVLPTLTVVVVFEA
jgi:hypothetical protein